MKKLPKFAGIKEPHRGRYNKISRKKRVKESSSIWVALAELVIYVCCVDVKFLCF